MWCPKRDALMLSAKFKSNVTHDTESSWMLTNDNSFSFAEGYQKCKPGLNMNRKWRNAAAFFWFSHRPELLFYIWVCPICTENSLKKKCTNYKLFSTSCCSNWGVDNGAKREITTSQQNQMSLLEKVFFHIYFILLIRKYDCSIHNYIS